MTLSALLVLVVVLGALHGYQLVRLRSDLELLRDQCKQADLRLAVEVDRLRADLSESGRSAPPGVRNG